MKATHADSSGQKEQDEELLEFRKFLGPLAEPYSEAQLRQLRREMYTLAELLLDIYLENRRRDNKRAGQRNFDQS
jgi:hypothetical protein